MVCSAGQRGLMAVLATWQLGGLIAGLAIGRRDLRLLLYFPRLLTCSFIWPVTLLPLA